MSKFKKIYLPLLVSVAMNTCNVHASTAAGNDPRGETDSCIASSSTISVTRIPTNLTDEQINAMTDTQINALLTKISPFQMAGHLTEEDQALAKAARASGEGKEYVPLKEYQLRMIYTYVDQILAARSSKPESFAASAQLIKDFIIHQLLPQVSTISSKVVDEVRNRALLLADGHNTNGEQLEALLTYISTDSSCTKVDPLKVEIDKIPSYMDTPIVGIFFGYTACMDAWWDNTPLAMMAVNPKDTGTYQSAFALYRHDTTSHNMEANPQRYVKMMTERKTYRLKKPSQETMALAVTQSYAQYEMFSSIVRWYIRTIKVDLIKAFSKAEAISDKYVRLAAKESARKYFNTRIGGLFWATHEERNSIDRTMGRANFQDALEALFSHRDFASAFGSQLGIILEEANTLLKTCNTSSVSDPGIQEVLQITHMDMLSALPKDLKLQYDVLVAKNATEWDAHIASLGDSALHDESSNPFFSIK